MGWIKTTAEGDGDSRVSDLDLLRVGPGKFACILSVVAAHPKTPVEYKTILGKKA